MRLQQLPGGAWSSLVRWTLAVTAASVLISVGLSELILGTLSQGLAWQGLLASIVLPVLLGGPLVFYLMLRQKQLQLVNEKLQVLASTDWLTACLNRRAFTHKVMDELDDTAEGAFLVIDADHFKFINDFFGHDRGDEALQLMADIIRANVRKNDLVGRIGGEEFGVFLPGTSLEGAHIVAERIRQAIAAAGFAPAGQRHPLSVSVGGAFFSGRIGFSDLFRLADQRLYGAKQAGRNRVEMARAGDLTKPEPRPVPLAKAG